MRDGVGEGVSPVGIIADDRPGVGTGVPSPEEILPRFNHLEHRLLDPRRFANQLPGVALGLTATEFPRSANSVSPFVEQAQPVSIPTTAGAIAATESASLNLSVLRHRSADTQAVFVLRLLFRFFREEHEVSAVFQVGPPVFPSSHDEIPSTRSAFLVVPVQPT